MAAKVDLTRGGIDQAVDAPNERRFAGPGRADDRGHAASFDSERDVLKHRLSGAILLAQIANDERAVHVIRHGLERCRYVHGPHASQATTASAPPALAASLPAPRPRALLPPRRPPCCRACRTLRRSRAPLSRRPCR